LHSGNLASIHDDRLFLVKDPLDQPNEDRCEEVMKKVKAITSVAAIETRRRRAMRARPAVKPVLADLYFSDLDPAQAPSASDELPHEVLENICAAMTQTGIDPAFIHAFRKTGYLLTEENIHLFTESELTEWNEAINEFRLTARMIQ
jgi:hypothetical protein